MRIIISPAKKMNTDTDSMAWETMPHFLEDAERLMKWMRTLTLEEARRLWGCNEKLAAMNYRRFQEMDLTRGLTPALLAYEGIQYQYMAPVAFTQGAWDYVQKNLRILSGFYGVLRPLDGVTPYRLEMQAKCAGGETFPEPCADFGESEDLRAGQLCAGSQEPEGLKAGQPCADFGESEARKFGKPGRPPGPQTLYDYWGGRLYREVLDESRVIVNLASKEYSKCVEPFITENDRIVTCVFGQLQDGKIVQKAAHAKMARGEMVRFMAENRVKEPEELRAFAGLGYRFAEEMSSGTEYVFIETGEGGGPDGRGFK